MLLEYAFIALCLAQILHFSRLLYRASRRQGEIRSAQALVAHLDWSRPAIRRRSAPRRGFLR